MKETPDGGIAFDGGAQRGLVGWALISAQLLMLIAVKTQNEHFSLGLDLRLDEADGDFQAIWKKSTDEAAGATPD
jgi:hypothetical protein